MGGHYFAMCLFNPQIDIYTFLKHYRESCEVLTSPLTLHLYHKNGFPWMIAFKNGESMYSGGLSPYPGTFKKLSAILWPGAPNEIQLTSPMHMARYFIYSNGENEGVFVCPDEDKELFEEMKDKLADSKDLSVRLESMLTEEDLRKNLHFQEKSGRFQFEFLRGTSVPITIDAKTVQFGDYVFPRDEVGVNAAFPNPYDEERYILVSLRGSRIQYGMAENYVDYLVFRDGDDGHAELLLHGFFDKSEKSWGFSYRMAYRSKSAEAFCRDGICPAPGDPTALGGALTGIPGELSMSAEHEKPAVTGIEQDGERWTFGGGQCRFPSVLAGPAGEGWTAWEEKGDIYLASLHTDGESNIIPVEDDASDSFQPVLATDGDQVWVIYLNDMDGYYRVYGRSIRDRLPSEPILISEEQPCDAVTPAAAWNGEGAITIAWSDWKANFRYPKYRTLDGRFLGDVQSIRIKRPKIDYTNAWCPSLACDRDGDVHGAWNQHYPLSLGVYAGNLTSEGAAVSDQEGGYPSVAFDSENRMWVVWETSLWNLQKGQTQMIQASFFDAEHGRWAIPYTVSNKEQTFYNQTPRAAAGADGSMWVTWSGREDADASWCVYISKWEKGSWSPPQTMSEAGENARAPAIAAAADGHVWVAWHSGTGADMRIKAVRTAGR